MTKEQITYLREIHGDENLHIFSDNAKIIDANAERTTLVWDDTNELLHVFERNVSQYNQRLHPYTVQSLAYDTIQYLTTNNNDTSIEDIFTHLNITGDKKTELLNKLKGIKHEKIKEVQK